MFSNSQKIALEELGLKCAAKIVLVDPLRRCIVPDRIHALGVALLERDDELPPRRKPREVPCSGR